MNVKGNLNVLREIRFGANFSTSFKRNRDGHLLFEIGLSVVNNEAQERNIFYYVQCYNGNVSATIKLFLQQLQDRTTDVR